MSDRTTCPTCNGDGESEESPLLPCPDCLGEGSIVPVSALPAGIVSPLVDFFERDDTKSAGRWVVLADGDLAYKPADGGGAWPFRYLDVHPFITLEGWNALVDLVTSTPSRQPSVIEVPAEALAIVGEWFTHHHGHPVANRTMADLERRLSAAGYYIDGSCVTCQGKRWVTDPFGMGDAPCPDCQVASR